MPKDPFTYVLELRRRYIPDLLWLGLGAIVVAIGIFVEYRGVWAVLAGVVLGGIGVSFVSCFAYRRRRRHRSDGTAG